MLVFSLCRVPDPAEIPPPRLLEALRLRLEETVTRDGSYSVVSGSPQSSYPETSIPPSDSGEPRTQVLFLDPAPFVPSLRDLVSTYFALSAVAKKKVEHVYLVGGGWKTSVRR